MPSRIDVTELGKLPEIFGGFPGLDGRAVQFEPLGSLVTGLEPF
ncbi:MAG: hypothetical protein P8186_29890 [Anaerolineae bacterium]